MRTSIIAAGVFVVWCAAPVQSKVIRSPIVSAVLVCILVAARQILFQFKFVFTVQKSEQGTPLPTSIIAQLRVIGDICHVYRFSCRESAGAF